MTKLIVDGREIDVPQDYTLLQACEAAGAEKSSFGDLLKQSIDGVAKTQEKAGQMAAGFERGDPGIDLAQVMIQGQKADLSFRAMTEVRNKMVDAYKEIINMSL